MIVPPEPSHQEEEEALKIDKAMIKAIAAADKGGEDPDSPIVFDDFENNHFSSRTRFIATSPEFTTGAFMAPLNSESFNSSYSTDSTTYPLDTGNDQDVSEEIQFLDAEQVYSHRRRSSSNSDIGHRRRSDSDRSQQSVSPNVKIETESTLSTNASTLVPETDYAEPLDKVRPTVSQEEELLKVSSQLNTFDKTIESMSNVLKNVQGWFNVAPTANSPTAAREISLEAQEFLVVQANWYFRRQVRLLRFEAKEFKRLDPKNNKSVRKTRSYQEIKRIRFSGKCELIISFEDGTEEWYETEKRDDIYALIEARAAAMGKSVSKTEIMNHASQ
eukprot:TRINITY_DN4068_c0_g1_i5.p1 TRINITY_DN4068_c0_g1~~TRINITY_DN4068_c0_g1_i5.p1  ORF type:complete len:331 (+),score=70.44 TRINITY_DN4068_c0_g1_i5:230-1222(+)